MGTFLGAPIAVHSEEDSKSSINIHSKKKLTQIKEQLDKKNISYSVTSKNIKKLIYSLYWGPFNNRHERNLAIKKMKQQDARYRVIKGGRYLYLGGFTSRDHLRSFLRKNKKQSISSFKIYRKQKKVRVYTLTKKQNENSSPQKEEDDVIALSSPDANMGEEGETEIFDQTASFDGPSQFSTLLTSSVYAFPDRPTNKDFRVFAKPSYEFLPENMSWNVSTGVVLDLHTENFSEVNRKLIEPHDTYIQYTGEHLTSTVGYQVVSWGRVFENSILDRFNRQNLLSGGQENLSDKSLAQLGLRSRAYWSGITFDFLLTPSFKTHKISENGEPWSPINFHTNHVLGFPRHEILEPLLADGSFGEKEVDDIALGTRVTKTFFNIETGVSLINSPSLYPYYTVNEETVRRINSGAPPKQAIDNSDGSTFVRDHPTQLQYALDAAFEAQGLIYRLELGYLNNTPVTSKNFEFLLTESYHWNLGIEGHPRDGQDTLNIILSMSDTQIDQDKVFDFTSTQYLSGRYILKFNQDFYEFEMKARLGLHEYDLQVFPQIHYKKDDYQRITLGGGYFDGQEKTFGGYYQDMKNVYLRWRYTF